MGKAYNDNSKIEEKELCDSVESLYNLVKNEYPLPKYWHYKYDKHLSHSLVKKIKMLQGYDESSLEYLDEKRKVEPDGGIIYAVKKDSSGNILQIWPLVISEAKHQDSGTGNAIERFFKNYNFYKNLFKWEQIFPFVTFAAGKDFGKETINTKLKVGACNEITNNTENIHKDVIIVNEKKELNPKLLFLTKQDYSKWEKNEIFHHLLEVFKQSYEYFFGKKIIKCETVMI